VDELQCLVAKVVRRVRRVSVHQKLTTLPSNYVMETLCCVRIVNKLALQIHHTSVKCAEPKLVINELLCFVNSKYDIQPKSVIHDTTLCFKKQFTPRTFMITV